MVLVVEISWLDFWKGLWRGLVSESGKSLNVKTPMSVTQELPTGYDRQLEETRIRQMICDFAQSQVGKPYKLGAEVEENPEKAPFWDCSELSQVAYRTASLDLPDWSPAQFDFCRPVKFPRPADLGFLWNERWGRIGHVAIYVGGGMVVDAVGGAIGQVRVAHASLIEDSPRFRGWRRHSEFMWPVEERA